MFKKFMILAAAALAMCSCSYKYATSTAYPVAGTTTYLNPQVCDLDVSAEKFTYVFYPSKLQNKALGTKGMLATAISEALEKAGNADVFIHPEYTADVKKGLFGKKFRSLKVSGYPAKYVNFHTGNAQEVELLESVILQPGNKKVTKSDITIRKITNGKE